ncbi:HIRAN domain-containing protein [Ileibacterium valens]|uniref:HIRAN domain-containing protein n=1 Tax=Ileibacterium valens TaxID=1862668 RepID=A0A1U7NI12_9FIRM|nr:HIRAN domain-containing protein [Ileibacterium valens]OLU36304.1 hypothetical protein BM735_12545 [Erysipelotrichaceae bacterium NYU-BL-F16]OLU41794.1 hypothetical protein BO222_02605 [Ileibacterium valens]OLU42646.1 hypothetical protein BO224_01620 [Erysipelotrichaceae bacterium NYU-BL-E8]
MSNALTKFDDSQDLIVFGDLPDLLKPMQERIYLDSVYAAGISHLDDPERPAGLKPQEKLRLIREPKNPNDLYAIRIENETGKKIGYIPKKNNRVFARLMDAGKMIEATVSIVKKTGRYYSLKVDLWMEDF